jgi:hypothetical protein
MEINKVSRLPGLAQEVWLGSQNHLNKAVNFGG